MHKFFWRLSYALHLKNLANLPLKQGWVSSEEAYEDNEYYELGMSPYEAAIEEISIWQADE